MDSSSDASIHPEVKDEQSSKTYLSQEIIEMLRQASYDDLLKAVEQRVAAKDDSSIRYKVWIKVDPESIYPKPYSPKPIITELIHILGINEQLNEKDKIDLNYYTASKKIIDAVFLREEFKKYDVQVKTIEESKIYEAAINKQSEDKTISSFKPTKKENQHKSPLNQILYGPPGTGKTYSTIAYAVAVCDEITVEDVLEMDRHEVTAKYKKLVANNQILFTTFHQSLGYEDFIEGIKPMTVDDKIVYEVASGILKKIAIQADSKKLTTSSNGNSEEVNNKNLDQETIADNNIEDQINSYFISKELPFTLTKKEKNGLDYTLTVSNINYHNQENVFHVDTKDNEKYFVRISESTIRKLFNKFGIDDIYTKTTNQILEVQRGSNSKILKLFYNDFVEFLNIKKLEISEAPTPPHVLIIDEINRGNVSAIFGELITLIEDGKRAGQPEELSVVLPYSREPFTLPANLYIIGTMNTADRSVEALDTALRRRFDFVEMMPRPDLLEDVCEEFDLEEMLTVINQRLTWLKDKNHTIGHAFFMGCDSPLDVIRVIAHNVLPLLEEFFYGDTSKIGLVLSPEFLDDEVHNGADIFTNSRAEHAGILLVDLSENKPRRSLSGPELLDYVKDDENTALQMLNSIL